MHTNYFDSPHREGYFELDDYDLYYRAFGDGDTVLLGLHGGPGGFSDYLAPLAQHGSDDMTVYLYDQFGCGRSDGSAAGDFDRYTVEHYRDEIEAVRQAISAESVIPYGHSWGSVIALEYALAYPDNVSKLVLSGGYHDTADAIEVMREARREVLTDEELETVRAHEAKGDFDDKEYQNLIEKVYSECLIRVENPIWREKGGINMDVYGLMWGPTEYTLSETARLRGWTVKDRLTEIDVPTLVLVGEYDEIGPAISRDIANRIPDAELAVIEDGSHHTYWEHPEEHYELVEEFLAK